MAVYKQNTDKYAGSYLLMHKAGKDRDLAGGHRGEEGGNYVCTIGKHRRQFFVGMASDHPAVRNSYIYDNPDRVYPEGYLQGH